MSNNKKVALITGGTRGIGLGIARALAADGFNLAVNGVRDEEAVVDVIRDLESNGVEVLYVQGDIGVAESRQKIIESVSDRFGRLDVLVNNAGIAPKIRADILKATEESFLELMRVNTAGPYFLTQAVARWMIEQKASDETFSGTIVFVTSVSATLASVNRGDYCMSKSALSMAAKLFATRLTKFGINVYEIRPGIIETDMTANVKEKYDKMFEEGLLLERRWGKSEDIGKITATLTRGDLPYCSGQVITADGGMTVGRL